MTPIICTPQGSRALIIFYTLLILLCVPHEQAHAGECALITLYHSDAIVFIDTATRMVTRTRSLPPPPRYCINSEAPPRAVFPSGIALTPDGTRAYVKTGVCAALRLDTATLSRGFIDREGSYSAEGAIVITPDGRRAFLTDSPTDSVLVLDLDYDYLSDTIPVADTPIDLAMTPDGRFLYVVSKGHLDAPDTVSVIDTATKSVAETITVGEHAEGIAMAPDGSVAYVTNIDSSSVSVIDTATNLIAQTIPLPGYPAFPTISPNGNILYVVTNYLTGFGLATLDTFSRTVTATVPVPGTGRTAITPDGTTLYMPDNDHRAISVIDTSGLTVETSIPLPKSACGPDYCSADRIVIGSIPGGCAACPGDCNGEDVSWWTSWSKASTSPSPPRPPATAVPSTCRGAET